MGLMTILDHRPITNGQFTFSLVDWAGGRCIFNGCSGIVCALPPVISGATLEQLQEHPRRIVGALVEQLYKQ